MPTGIENKQNSARELENITEWATLRGKNVTASDFDNRKRLGSHTTKEASGAEPKSGFVIRE